MNLENAVRKYLDDNFIFRMFEIDKWLYNRFIFRYKHKHKQGVESFSERLDIDFLSSSELNSWTIVSDRAIDYFLSDFSWHIIKEYKVLAGTKGKKKVIKDLMLSMITNDLHKVVHFDKRIEPMFALNRIKVSNTKVLPINKRTPVYPGIGETCYIFRGSGSSKIVDPCFIYEKDEDNKMFKVMYFTNFGDYHLPTKKLKINGYGFTSVYPTEIGKTPEEAVMNKF